MKTSPLLVLLLAAVGAAPAPAVHYIYDATGQFVSVSYDTQKQAVFTYDPAGNITAIATRSVVVNSLYSGLVAAPEGEPEKSGSLSVKLTDKRTFTATFVIGGKRYTLRGEFSALGAFDGVLNRGSGLPALDVTMTLDVIGGSEEIDGTLMQGGVLFANLGADKSTYTKANPTPDAGAYTVLLPADPTQTNSTLYPQGYGYGTLTVSPIGTVKLAGVLGDGTKVSLGARAAQDRTWPLYLAPYAKGQGVLSGTVAFHDIADVSDLDATLDWTRPALTGAPVYSAGFSGSISLFGSRYVKPAKNERAIAVAETTGNLLVHFESGGLAPGGKDVIATLLANNKVVAPLGEKFTLTLTTSSGLFRGSFLESVGGKVRPFAGVLLQKQAAGAGLFFGNAGSGAVDISGP